MRKRPLRYCEMCDTWVKATTCAACGMPTRKAEKPT